MSREKVLKIARSLIVIAVYIGCLFLARTWSHIPYSLNLLFLPIIFAGFLISASASVGLAILTAFYLFLTSGILDLEKILSLSFQSLSFIIVAVASGIFSSYLKSKQLQESIEKNRLQSLNKVSTNFIASLEPAAVYDQFTREVRKIMAVDASALVKISPLGNIQILAEENAGEILKFKNLLALKQAILKIKNDEVTQLEKGELSLDGPFNSIYISPVINGEYVILFSEKKRKLTADEINLLKTFLDEAHLALNGAHYFAFKEKQAKLIDTIAELNKAAASLSETDELIFTSLKKVSEFLKSSFSVFLGINEEKVNILATYEKTPGLFDEKLMAIEKAIKEGELWRHLITQSKPLIEFSNSPSKSPTLRLLQLTGYKALIYLPLTIQDKPAGAILAFFDKESESESNAEFLESLVSEVSMVLYNSRLLGHIKNLTLKTVESIANAFDSANPYTKGHSIKVAKYATEIAKELGLGFKEIREIQYAALLHDMGRIFINSEILNAPRKLSEGEFEKVKKIPEISSKIFEKINFFSSIIPIIYHHKEHYDGTGYPSGLKGESIPLGSRIIHVAESFVAMTSERPHRPALNVVEAIEEIRKGIGKQFDPKVVEALLKVLKKEYPSIFVNIVA